MSKSFECPSCGALISVEENGPLRVECPNCYEMVVNPHAGQQTNSNLSGTINLSQSSGQGDWRTGLADVPIINVSGNDGNFVDGVAANGLDVNRVRDVLEILLVQRAGIFSGADIVAVRKYMIPYHVFQVTYQAPWKGQYEWMEYDMMSVSQKFQKKDTEASGTADGVMVFACKACSVANFPHQLQGVPDTLSQMPGPFSPYRSEDGADRHTVIVQPATSFANTWKDVVAPQLANRAQQEVGQQASANVGSSFMESLKANKLGAKLKNLECQVNYQITACQSVLIPYWLAEYTYEGQRYSVVIDGAGNPLLFEAPQEKESSTSADMPKEESTQAEMKGRQEYHTTDSMENHKDWWASFINNAPLILLVLGIVVVSVTQSASDLIIFACIIGVSYYYKKRKRDQTTQNQ